MAEASELREVRRLRADMRREKFLGIGEDVAVAIIGADGYWFRSNDESVDD